MMTVDLADTQRRAEWPVDERVGAEAPICTHGDEDAEPAAVVGPAVEENALEVELLVAGSEHGDLDRIGRQYRFELNQLRRA